MRLRKKIFARFARAPPIHQLFMSDPPLTKILHPPLLRMSYLDDISLGGDLEDISNDLVMFKQGAKDVGLQLNPNKCEIISVVPDSQNSILSLLPGSRIVNLSMATLLGSPLGDVPGISSVLTEKTNLLKIMGERLPLLSTHDGLPSFAPFHCPSKAVVLSSHSTMLLITTTSAVRCCSQNNYVQHLQYLPLQ